MYQDSSSKRNLVLAIVGGLSVTALIGAGLYFWSTRETKPTAPSIPVADAIVTLNKNHIRVIEPDNNQTLLAEWDLPVERIMSNRMGTGVYVITSETPHKFYEIQMGTEPILKEKYSFDYDFTTETEWRVDEDSIILFEPSRQLFTKIDSEFLVTQTVKVEELQALQVNIGSPQESLDENAEELEIEPSTPVESELISDNSKKEESTVKEVSHWSSSDEVLAFSLGQTLYQYHWDSQTSKPVSTFEDDIADIFIQNNRLFTLNHFGSQANFTTLFEHNLQTNAITQMEKLSGVDIQIIPSLIQNTTLVLSQEKTNEVYDVEAFKSIGTVSVSLTGATSIWAAHDFIYLIGSDQIGRAYSIYSTKPQFQTLETVEAFYPIWEKTYESIEAETQE